MDRDQFARITSAIEYTLDQLRRGPKSRQDDERPSAYEDRCHSFYDAKYRFCLFAIRCLKQVDKMKAELYLDDLRQLRELI
jgi:hypothetical protein